MPDLRRALIPLLIACAVLLSWTAVASADPLTGQLTDAATGTPIPEATVRVLGTNERTATDSQGRWRFDLPPGDYELAIRKTLGGEDLRIRLVNQRVPQYKPGRAHLYTDYFLNRSSTRPSAPWGLPITRPTGPTHRDRGPVDLSRLFSRGFGGVNQLGIPGQLPATIRVGRRKDPKKGCSNNPIVAIEEVSLEEYSRGVLPPEIGVFRNLKNVEAVYRAFALAAKSYGLWFVLYYDANRRRTVSSPKPPNNYTWFHIDDTACNQRYSDTRLGITDRAAADVKDKILTKKGDPNRLDKYEYAASCARHGTRPEYQTALVADKPPSDACVGSWCGHAKCAGHADNPDKPGSDRCLVRGICQWGAASWGEAGKDHRWLISHYQPNLAIRDLSGGQADRKVVLTGYVYRDANDIAGTGIPGATVDLSTGASTTTDAKGVFRFRGVPVKASPVTIRASKSGFQTNDRQKKLEANKTNWGSIKLVEKPSMPGKDTGPDAMSDAGSRTDTGTSMDASSSAGDAASTDAALRAPADGSNENDGDDGPREERTASYGGLGPMIGPSAGIRDRGCSLVPARHTAPGVALGVFLLGFFTLRRRAGQEA